ncbi:MAG: hypothetical protein JW818_11425 [Pirellulales bacterium]|nr:hypothetical protein [Pirellulales bacterium]
MSHAAFLPTIVSLLLAAVPSRTWTDSTGKYQTQAEMIAQSDKLVVLKRKDHSLVAVPIDKLSQKDRDFLKSKETKNRIRQAVDQVQTWTLQSGLKVNGRVVDYGQKKITIQRRRGKTYVNDKAYKNLPEIYRRMISEIVNHFENLRLSGEAAFENWVLRQGGVLKNYTIEGVIMELENGDEYVVPFFLFSDADQKVLQPGWKRWQAAQKTPARDDDRQETFLLQSAAQAYRQNQRVNRQISIIQLQLHAIQAGLTGLWEVHLMPGPGAYGYPLNVIVLARDSRQATFKALRRNSGYIAGPVRKVAGW